MTGVRGVRIRPAQVMDVPDLTPRLRETDVREIVLLSGATPRAALDMSLRRSDEAYTVEINGSPEAMFGHRGTFGGRAAMVWALGSDLLPERRMYFIKEMRAYLNYVGDMFPRLVNVVEESNEPSKQLLIRLGFTLGDCLPAMGGGVAQSFWRAGNV